MNQQLGDVLDEVWSEVERAQAAFPAMNSYHEGWAVMYEEVCELFEEIRKKQMSGNLIVTPHVAHLYQDSAKIRAEAVQVASMAVRLILDCCDAKGPKLQNKER